MSSSKSKIGIIKGELSPFMEQGDTSGIEIRDQDGRLLNGKLSVTSLVEMDGKTEIPFKQWSGEGRAHFYAEYYPKEFYIHYEYKNGSWITYFRSQ